MYPLLSPSVRDREALRACLPAVSKDNICALFKVLSFALVIFPLPFSFEPAFTHTFAFNRSFFNGTPSYGSLSQSPQFAPQYRQCRTGDGRTPTLAVNLSIVGTTSKHTSANHYTSRRRGHLSPTQPGIDSSSRKSGPRLDPIPDNTELPTLSL